jgi:integrase/recombinase XerD
VTYRRLPQPFTAEELDHLEMACADDMDFWFALVFLNETGLRISEACSISRELAESWTPKGRNVIPIARAKPTTTRVVGKGDKERVVVLSRRALGAAQKLLEVPRSGLRSNGSGWRRQPDKLFPWSVRMMQERLQKLSEKAGVHAYPHRFRHTFIQQLVDSGAPIHVVADMVGHSSIQTTRVYFEASPTAKTEALEGRRKFLRRR